MGNDELLPRILRCPVCNGNLNDIVYGLVTDSLADTAISGGCIVDADAPTKACVDCDWRGALGGRGWATEFTQTTHSYDENEVNNTRIEVKHYNLVTMGIPELIEYGARNLESRFELVRRGFDPEQVDQMYKDGVSLPLIEKGQFFVFRNKETDLIEQVCLYMAHRNQHEFFYLRPGFLDWEMAATLDQFHSAVFEMKKENIAVWCEDVANVEMSEEDESSFPFNYGFIPVTKMLDREALIEDEMFRYADLFKKPIFWPNWFDPGIMLARMEYLGFS
jgi:hypothetical protein